MGFFDTHKNFARSLIATAPSPATSGTSLIVTAGQGSLFPAVPFNAVICPAGSLPTSANAEIVRVTAIATDTFTITRTQESTSARTVVVGDQIFAGMTVKTFTDIEQAFDVVGGRLTLTSGTPIDMNDATAKTNVFYTPYRSSKIGLYDGVSAWNVLSFSEITLPLGTLINAQAYDVFAYNNAGAVALEMAEWKNATVTMTIASPCVVSWTSHGLFNGASVTFTTSGALPTGVTANTRYFATVVDANSFKLSTTLANVASATFVNTSGTQSGTHTGHHPLARQTALVYQDGVLVKSGSTTRRYLGSFMTTSTTTTEDSDVKRLLFNHYNRVRKRFFKQETGTGSWTYTTAVTRQANGNAANQVEVLVGYPDYVVNLILNVLATNTGGGIALFSGIGINDTANATTHGVGGEQITQASVNGYATPSFVRKSLAVGNYIFTWLENSTASGTTTWYGTGNSLLHGDTEA